MNTYKVAILATGGMDSTCLIYDAVKEGHNPVIVTVDYGQKASNAEQSCLNKHIDKLKLSSLVVLPLAFGQAKPALFTEGYIPKKEMHCDAEAVYDDGEMKYGEFFIEGRNALIAITALAYCSVNRIDELRTGFVNNQATWDKQRSSPHLFTNDSSPHFVDAINTLALTGFSHYVRLRAPYLDERLDKQDVYNRAIGHGIDVANDTYSCYFYPPCGTCLSCKTRSKFIAQD